MTCMKDDAVIARIRKARHEISAECGHDPKKLVEYYMRLQETPAFKDRLAKRTRRKRRPPAE